MQDKINIFYYRLTQAVSLAFSKIVFRRKMMRNELKGAKGPFVVIANHQSEYDFVNLISAVLTPMRFVISSSFFNAMPVIHNIIKGIGAIPKQQFQPTIPALRKMKSVIDGGEPLVLYPAGLMCEDGISTPIPMATYKFLKYLNADIYMARTYGAYFVMPKWTKGFRPGRTYMDIYRLFSKEELKILSVDEIKAKAEEALLFNAYAEQEKFKVKYSGSNKISGLENVLYMCPHCGEEFAMQVKDDTRLCCDACGYEEHADAYGFLHHKSVVGKEYRHVSDWSAEILARTREMLRRSEDFTLSDDAEIHMIDYDKHTYVPVGQGKLTLTKSSITLKGIIKGEDREISFPTALFPSLPFVPGKRLEIQDGQESYRCVLHNGKLAMKFINLLKAAFELQHTNV